MLEAIAIAAGFNPEGGSIGFRFESANTHSGLHSHLELDWRRQPRWGWFFRGESFYGVKTELDTLEHEYNVPQVRRLDIHQRSHGESFVHLLGQRFNCAGLYLLDEPESALAPTAQLALLHRINDLVKQGGQFIIATHSPLVMAWPGAAIYELSAAAPPERKTYDELPAVQFWRSFLSNPTVYVEELLRE